MIPFEVDTDDQFLDDFLMLVSDHDAPKLVASIDSQGQPLDAFKIAWSASLVEEQGLHPLISVPSDEVTYFIFISTRTGLTGYLSFYPIEH